MDTQDIFRRDGDFVRFNQYGVKLDFPDSDSEDSYYSWLDRMGEEIDGLVPGAEIVEKASARSEPRFNTGVYYDTADYRLLRGNMVLRTTSNPKTHAFCAFKLGQDPDGTRKDHRHIFDGVDKLTIQLAPTSSVAVDVVKGLLDRTDIVQPGMILREHADIGAAELSPAVCVAQYRRTFYVWLDKLDALRCSLDRAHVLNLREDSEGARYAHFSEVEVPIYPRISPSIAQDPRLRQLINSLARSLSDEFGVDMVVDSKYQRGARALGMDF